ncbi:MAG: helix-turn-helix domain-containing protein [Methyloceanibacter sp.]|nr:helix-turn-helix domain-containing protein [Methyloceanibacter sp.]
MTETTNDRAEVSLPLGLAERDRNTAVFGAAADRNSACVQLSLQAEFSDIDHLCKAVRDWNLDFRPLGRPAVAKRLARLVQAQADRVHYGYARCLLNLEQRGAPPPQCVTFGVLEHTVRRLWWRGRDIDSATIIVFPFGGELHSISGADFGVHTVSVHVSLIEEVCIRLQLDAMPGFGPPETFQADAQTLRFLRSELMRLAAPNGPVRPVRARCVAETFVSAWRDAGQLTPPLKERSGCVRTMRLALERIDAPDWLVLTPADLCDHAGVGERTLQNAFRDRFGTTPAAFLKARRLAAVRAALKNCNDGLAVGDIAADYGFFHTGQFAADYRRAYGELPSETLWRSQGGATRR